MATQLVILASTLTGLQDQVQRQPMTPVRLPLSVSHIGPDTHWLVPPDHRMESAGGQLLAIGRDRLRDLATLDPIVQQQKLPFGRSTHHNRFGRDEVWLAIGHGAASGHLAALSCRESSLLPLDEIDVVGGDRLRLGSVESISSIAVSPPAVAPVQASDPWGPTAAAIGPDAWHRFTSTTFTIIGAGRMGSAVAQAIDRNGGRVTVVDDDCIEPHNLGEMELVSERHVGQSKAVTLASLLARSGTEPSDRNAVTESVLSTAALTAIRQSNFLIGAVDNPTARLANTFLASLYLRPLLDLGTGIFHSRDDEPSPDAIRPQSVPRRMGADIRLVLPGRCLACCGGIVGLRGASQSLRSLGVRQEPPHRQAPWFEQRSGSLRSLNACAMGLGLRLIEDWLARRFEDSRWFHLEFSDDGLPRLETREFGIDPTSSCPVCRLAGHGDAALRRLPDVLAALDSASRQEPAQVRSTD